MTTSATPGPGPTENSLRRALKRARDGVTLDVSEAAVLLQARGEHLADLTASAARVRDAGLDAAGRPVSSRIPRASSSP
jgi:FO synthase